MKNALVRQAKYLAEISPSADSTKLLNLSETEQQSKRDNSTATDIKYREINEKYLLAIDETFKKGLLSETSPFNSNMTKLFKEVKKQTKAIEKMSSDRAKEITGKSMNIDQFKTIRERIQDFGKGVKDFFTLKGFVNKTGLVKEDSGGIISTAINRRARRMEYIEERKKVDPNNIALQGLTGRQRSLAEERLYGGQFDQQQTIKRQQRGNEAEIAKLERAGFNESQIKRSGLLNTRESLAGQLEKVDSRVRVSKDNEKEKATTKRSTSKEAVSAESFSDEAAIENQRAQDKMVDLLAKIEENTRGNAVVAEKKPEAGKGGLLGMFGGILESALGFLKKGLITALKFIFNPRNILKFVTKIFLPAMIIGSIVNGIVDAFKAFFNGGSFVDVLVAGLGGVLEFLTFGLLDAESLKAGLEWMGNAVNEYIIEPVKQFFSWMGNIFSEYIMQPILNIGTKLYGLLDEYVLTPLANLFQPVADFFKKIKDQLFGFFEDFGIPEIGFTIPGIDKKVSIGPFYPFRPKEGTNRVASNSDLKQTSSTSGETSKLNENIVTSGKEGRINKETGETYYRGDKTRVVSQGEKVVNGKATFTSNMAEFDPSTGKATISGDEGEREISKRAFNKIKSNAKSGGDATAVREIIKEDDAYQKLGFFDKLKVDTGFAKATELLEAQKPQPSTGNAIYNKSANNAAAAQAPQPSAPVIVNAPTSVSNTSKQNIAMPTPIRNEDSGFNRYMNRSAFAN